MASDTSRVLEIQDDRLSRVEEELRSVCTETALQGQRLESVKEALERLSIDVERKIEEVLVAIRPMAHSINDPEQGVMARLKVLEQERARQRAFWSWVAKLAVPVLAGILLYSIGVK